MEKAKKITKRESFTEIKGILAEMGKERLVKVMEHELELLDRKSASNGKMTKAQELNAELKNAILAEMEKGKEYTVTMLMKELPTLVAYRDGDGNTISNQKTSSLVSALVKDGKLERISKNRKSYFVVVE